jgi:hypothetical protein
MLVLKTFAACWRSSDICEADLTNTFSRSDKGSRLMDKDNDNLYVTVITFNFISETQTPHRKRSADTNVLVQPRMFERV